MGTKLISLDASAEASLSIPDTIPSSVVSGMIIPFVEPAVAALVATGARVVSIAVRQYKMLEVEIEYYQRWSEVLRKEVIPIVAIVEAGEAGMNYLEAYIKRPDLREMGIQKIKDRITKRLDKLP